MLKKLKQSSFLSGAALSLWALSTPLAAAETTCTLNGQEVPCEELGEAIGGMLGWGIALILLVGVLGVLASILWLVMIIHAAKHDIENKGMWIILMVLMGPIGAIVYYFMVKRGFNEAQIDKAMELAKTKAAPMAANLSPAPAPNPVEDLLNKANESNPTPAVEPAPKPETVRAPEAPAPTTPSPNVEPMPIQAPTPAPNTAAAPTTEPSPMPLAPEAPSVPTPPEEPPTTPPTQ